MTAKISSPDTSPPPADISPRDAALTDGGAGPRAQSPLDKGAGNSAAPPAPDCPHPKGPAAPSAHLETVNELSGFRLSCAADDCRAGPEDGTLRLIGGERWFVCRNGHLNAEVIDDIREAA